MEWVQTQTRNLNTNRVLGINTEKTCDCPPNHLNCMSAKEWIKCQLGVWQFAYQGQDIRDKNLHPATMPLAMAEKVISLFTHKGELVIDPFNGSGTTLLAAQNLNRNAVGFDINPNYVKLSESRLKQTRLSGQTRQFSILDDARHISNYLPSESVKLSLTSPPYGNLLNRKRTNRSRKGVERHNEQFGVVEQYSQKKNDLGTLDVDDYEEALVQIYKELFKLTRPKGHAVVNITDMWWEGKRVPLHINVVNALTTVGFTFKNTVIWDRLNIVNRVGIFGWPSNYITMGTTFEYILNFQKL